MKKESIFLLLPLLIALALIMASVCIAEPCGREKGLRGHGHGLEGPM